MIAYRDGSASPYVSFSEPILKKFGMNVTPLQPIHVILIHLELIIRVIWRTNELVSASEIFEKYKRFVEAIFWKYENKRQAM